MYLLKNNYDSPSITKVLGKDYSFYQKIKMGGTGSAKMVYLKGVRHFSKLSGTSRTASYVNFQLYPGGLVLRLSKSTSTDAVIISKKEIDSILVECRKVSIRYDSYFKDSIYKLTFDAFITISLKESETVQLYCPQTFFKPMKSYFKKGWLGKKTRFTISPEPPIKDNGNLILNALESLIN